MKIVISNKTPESKFHNPAICSEKVSLDSSLKPRLSAIQLIFHFVNNYLNKRLSSEYHVASK